MDEESREKIIPANHVVHGHKICQTREAAWLCLDDIYQKFLRPNFYDIGGTYIDDVADYWFMFKTEQIGNIFLLHLFVCNHQEGSFDIGVSHNANITFNKKEDLAFLSSSFKVCNFKKIKERSQNYLTTYNYSDLDIDMLKEKKLYVAISFPIVEAKSVSQKIIDHVKINHDFGALLTDPIGYDFTMESADGAKFHVHKVLLAAHSEVFKAMLKEETAESQNNYVKLIDIGKEDLQCILEFVYKGTVTDLENSNFFNLLMLADKYNLKGLSDLSQYVLSQQLNLDNALEVLLVADMYNSEMLKMAALKFIKRNVSVLQSNTFKEINNAALVRELCTFLVPSN